MGEYVDTSIIFPSQGQCGTSLRGASPFINEATRIGRRPATNLGSYEARRQCALGLSYGPYTAGPAPLPAGSCAKAERAYLRAYRNYRPAQSPLVNIDKCGVELLAEEVNDFAQAGCAVCRCGNQS